VPRWTYPITLTVGLLVLALAPALEAFAADAWDGPLLLLLLARPLGCALIAAGAVAVEVDLGDGALRWPLCGAALAFGLTTLASIMVAVGRELPTSVTALAVVADRWLELAGLLALVAAAWLRWRGAWRGPRHADTAAPVPSAVVVRR